MAQPISPEDAEAHRPEVEPVRSYRAVGVTARADPSIRRARNKNAIPCAGPSHQLSV